MTDGFAATTTSSVASGNCNSKTPAVKDKECPYCHLIFTSSSLGRHLDLYIKEKHAKPPDNIHNVDEIRRMRGTITRRQARNSAGKRHGSASSSSKTTPILKQRAPIIQKDLSLDSNLDDGPVKTYVNRANWQSTGVINDLPPVSKNDPEIHFPERTFATRGPIKQDLARKEELMSVMDRGRAAEMALKEVLDTVKSANMHAHPSLPFEFNFLACSLPEIYLKSLSPPPELLLGSPDLHKTSWPIDPPSSTDCNALHESVIARLREWRRRQQSTDIASAYTQNGVNEDNDEVATRNGSNTEESKYFAHLADVWKKWSQISDEDRRITWQYECAKAFARAQEKHVTTTQKLQQAEHEIFRLREEISQMKMQRHTSTTYPLSDLYMSQEALNKLPGSSAWDYESLVSRWRLKIQYARSAQSPLPSSSWSLQGAAQTHTNGYADHTQFGHKDPGYQDVEQDLHSNEDDEELEDAPGDEDDGQQEQTFNGQNGMTRGVLDPHLRGGGDLNEEEYAGGTTLMNLGSSYRSVNGGRDFGTRHD